MDEKKIRERSEELSARFKPLDPEKVIRILSVGEMRPFAFSCVKAKAKAEPVKCRHPDCIVRSVLDS